MFQRFSKLEGVCRALTSDRGNGREALVRHVARAFDFLTDREGARETIEDEGSRTVIAFVAGEVFVEVELDWRERAAFTLVGMTVDGRRPGGYHVDEHGRKVRWHLVEAVHGSDDSGAPELESRLRSVVRRSGREAMMSQVDVSAEVVRRLWPDLPALVGRLRGKGPG